MVGDTLTATYSSGNGSGAATWQWLAGGVDIVGANNSSYTAAAADFGKTLQARVSYADQSGTVTSAATSAVNAPYFYIITGSGGSFTATRSGMTVGTVGSAIQTVIDDIRADAAGNACTVQFEDGTNTLNIGANSASFTGAWGAVTLSGKITGNISGSGNGTISVSDSVSITSTPDIQNSTGSGNTIKYNSTGTLTIISGTVSQTGASGGNAVSNDLTANVIISGGTVSATSGSAVVNNGTGKITVSGGTVTSAAASSTQGTIQSVSSAPGTTNRLEISGGTVQNTSGTGNAVYNSSTGGVAISGGIISATGSGLAVLSTNASSMLTLDGSPSITGNIQPSMSGVNGNLTVGGSFAPVGTYVLDYATYASNDIAGIGGASFSANFTHAGGLKTGGSDLLFY
jgi:hypothetical protein